MRHAGARLQRQGRGFTAVELVSVLAMSALILGSLIVGYGTIVRSRPGVASLVNVPLGAARLDSYAYPPLPYGTTRNVSTAPHYGTLALAEELREQFNADVISATAVFCLPRDGVNNFKTSTIPYDPLQHGELDTPQKFRAHLVAIGVVPMPFRDYRNPLNNGLSTPSENASIFILGYSKVESKLKVQALYEIDLVRFANAEPLGIYASVRRYSENPDGPTLPLAFSGGYDVFYPPSIPAPSAKRPEEWASDGFTPLFITFERSTRLSIAEGSATDRFKLAAERPFYFIWWPDPAARHLGPVTNTLNMADPRQAYNHMGGRTSFMFTIPMFPAL